MDATETIAELQGRLARLESEFAKLVARSFCQGALLAAVMDDQHFTAEEMMLRKTTRCSELILNEDGSADLKVRDLV